MDNSSIITHTGTIKGDHDDVTLKREDIQVKIESPSVDASPSAQSDEDLYEDAGDLDFSGAAQSLYLTRIPKYLWESWCNLTDDDDEIELGTVRVEGGLDDVKRVRRSPNLIAIP